MVIDADVRAIEIGHCIFDFLLQLRCPQSTFALCLRLWLPVDRFAGDNSGQTKLTSGCRSKNVDDRSRRLFQSVFADVLQLGMRCN